MFLTIFTAAAAFALIPSNARAFKVVIDPGHGGSDHGAVRQSVRESEVVLKLAHRVKKSFANHPAISVEMTRQTDHLLSLKDRVQKTDALKADLFISLHANVEPTQQARGIEIFFQNNLPPDEEALYLAHLENQEMSDETETEGGLSKQGDLKAIVDDLHRQANILSSLRVSQNIEKRLPEVHMQIKQAPFYVLSKSRTPSILMEIGFMSNPIELKKMQSEEYQEKLVRVLRDTIEDQAQRKGVSRDKAEVLR